MQHTYPRYRLHLCIQPSDVAIPDPLRENLDYITDKLIANDHMDEAQEVARYMTGVRQKLITSSFDLVLYYAVDAYESLFWATNMLFDLQRHRATHTMTFSLILQVAADFDIVLSNADFYPL